METHETVRPPVGCVFGPFTLDFVRRLAWRDGVPVPLAGKSFEVLTYLIAHRDRVVTKDDLLRDIWPDTFVQENNLVRHVSTLRKALGQRPDQHDFVLTVQGRGYRFVAQVTDLETMPASLQTSLETTSPLDANPEVVELSAPELSAPRPAVRLWALAWRASLGVASVAVLVLVWAASDISTPRASSRVLRPVTFGPSVHAGPSWSPDGLSLAFAAERDGNFDIFIQGLDAAAVEPRRLTFAGETDWQPAWSPDGQWVAFRSERNGGGLFVVPAGGGPDRQVSSFGFDPRWSPDSKRILFSTSATRRPRPLPFVVGLDGAPPRSVLADASGLFNSSFAWHPDGRLSIAGVAQGRWRLVVAPLDGDSVEVPLSPELAAEMSELELTPGKIAWAPDGRHLYLEGRSHGVSNLWRVEVDPRTLAWRGSFERLTTGQAGDHHLAVSPDGKRLAFESGAERTRIWSFPLEAASGRVSGAGSPVTPGGSGEFDAAVSRDGRQLVYRTFRDGRQELWQHSITDGRERRLLTDQVAQRSSPRWSPDGSSLIYLVSNRGAGPASSSRLAILSTAGGGERFVSSIANSDFIPDDWSSDGRSVLGACDQPNTDRSGICLVALDGSAPSRLVASDPERSLRNARYSPDQAWISFTAHRASAGTGTLYVRPVGGGQPIPMTDDTAHVDKAHWAPDGRTIYFVSNRGGFLNVWGRRFDPTQGQPLGSVFRVTAFDGLSHGLASDLQHVDLAVSSDRLFLPVTEHPRQVWILEGVDR